MSLLDNRFVQLAENFLSTTSIVVANIADDPSYFFLQVARRFRTRFFVRILTKSMSQAWMGPILNAVSATLRDDDDALASASSKWLASRQGDSLDKQAVLLANLCIAAGQWNMAQRMLAHSPHSRSKSKSAARLAWSLGNMSRAIEILGQWPARHQLKHYVSEARTLAGQEPSLNANALPPLGLGNAQSVLYLATNSLPHTGSGYAQRTQSLLMALATEGWDVKAATRVNYPLNIGKIAARSHDVVSGVDYERFLPIPSRSDLTGRIQQQADQLLKKVLRERPSILHTTTDYSNALAVKAVSEATGIPWIYEVRGQLADTWLSTRPDKCIASERYKLFVEREAFVARHAHHVFTLGEEMRSNLVSAGVESRKISLLPNGIGERFLEEPVSRRVARTELGLDQEAFYVGTVSSLVPYEGLSTLVRAAATLMDRYPRLRLLIVGDGTDRQNLIHHAEELGIAGRCEFPGRVRREQSHLYHRSLNVFAVPRIDSKVTRSVTPLKPVEALASAVPVLASNLPALAELIQEGENGHLVAADDVPGWTNTIENLLARPKVVDDMGWTGRKFVLENRTWTQNARHLSDVYHSVINQAKLSGR